MSIVPNCTRSSSSLPPSPLPPLLSASPSSASAPRPSSRPSSSSSPPSPLGSNAMATATMPASTTAFLLALVKVRPTSVCAIGGWSSKRISAVTSSVPVPMSTSPFFFALRSITCSVTVNVSFPASPASSSSSEGKGNAIELSCADVNTAVAPPSSTCRVLNRSPASGSHDGATTTYGSLRFAPSHEDSTLRRRVALDTTTRRTSEEDDIGVGRFSAVGAGGGDTVLRSHSPAFARLL